MFKTLVNNANKKAKILKGVIKNITADTYQRAGETIKLWEILDPIWSRGFQYGRE